MRASCNRADDGKIKIAAIAAYAKLSAAFAASGAKGWLIIGFAVIVVGNLIPGAVCWATFRTGYRLRS